MRCGISCWRIWESSCSRPGTVGREEEMTMRIGRLWEDAKVRGARSPATSAEGSSLSHSDSKISIAAK